MDEHLSQISTMWTMLFAAQNPEAEATAAQQQLLVRYCRPIYSYLMHIVKDANTADDLAQEFATRFVEGKFHKADPERGRFRDYVKTCLFNLVREYHRKQQRQPAPISEDLGNAAVDVGPEDEHSFVSNWREELLQQTWEALKAQEESTGQLYFTVLHHKSQHPEQTSADMANRLSEVLQKPLTAPGVRQLLHRARDRFADLLLQEIARSVRSEDLNVIEDELIELNLYPYCKDALEKRKANSG